MDPLSVIAGVAGTAAMALHASRRLYELVDGIVNGPAELVAMRRDTNELLNILAGLETIVRGKENKEDKDISDVIQRLNQPLDNCMETLKALETLIQKSVKPTGELKKSKWRTFASTFREKELKGLTGQLAAGKLTLDLALTTINTIHSAHIQKDTNKISGQIAELRADLKNTDSDKVHLASVRGRKGSDSRTDFGFALERFLENVTVMDRPPSQGSVRSDLIESSENLPSEITGDEALVESKEYRASNGGGVTDAKKIVRKAAMIEFHPINSSVYDGSRSIPSTYEELKFIPTVIDATDRNSLQGNLPIHEASAQGRIGVLEDLLLLEPDLEAVDDHGLTALHKAASISRSCQVAIMNLLIAKGAKVDSTDDLGATPLHHAAWQGCDEAVCLLLRYDASPNEVDNIGWTPLQLAVYQGNIRTVEHFLSNISEDNIDLAGPGGTTALILAAEKGHEDMVKLLLENGATVNLVDRYGSSALHHAAANGFAGVIDVLSHGGANIESENHRSARPLHVAAQFGQSEAAETLLSLGADPNITVPNWWPALHQAASRGHINVINVLLSRNADIEKRGQYKKTAIIWAGEIGQSGSVRYLVGHGANFNAQDQFGETALHYAAANGHTEVVRVLASKGANPGIPNTRLRRPLHGAASEYGGIYSTTKILLDHGANPSDKDETGCIPLHYAAQNGNERLVRLLLDHGADWRATNLNGKLAVDLAGENGHVKVAKALREDRDSTKIQPGFEPDRSQLRFNVFR